MVDLIAGLRAEVVRRNLERVRAEIADAGRDPAEVEILAAIKYLPVTELARWPTAASRSSARTAPRS